MFSIAGTPTLQLHTALYAPIIGATNNFVNSTVKTPVTDAKVSEATKNLFKVNTDNTPIIRNKLEYLFGNATGRQHNIKRSHNMALDLKGIGIMDNREAIKENLIKVYNDSFSIMRRREHFNPYDNVTYNVTERESFLMGISNEVKLESVWWNNELKTVIIKK
jgi:hypothetical protein